MKSWGNRLSLHRSMVNRLVGASKGSNLRQTAPTLPDELATWLAQLTLLYGVPTEYLVPDTRVLPTESIRFFFLDRNWLDRLVDGALSAGVLSSKDDVFNQAFFEHIYHQIDEAQLHLRSELRGKVKSSLVTTGGTISGLLIRSQAVSGWPGMEINAYKAGQPLTILRMDCLSPNVLLCLFYDVPDRVEFIEPAEGLHFGVTRAQGAETFQVSLRGLGFPVASPYPAGEQIPKKGEPGAFLTAPGKLRSGAGQPKGVVDITDLVASIKRTMPAGALEGGVLTTAGFAVQLTQGAGLQEYQVKDSQGNPYPACGTNNG